MMRKAGLMMMAALIAGIVHAADVSVSADFASAYIFRGVTLNDGLVFQPGAEISGFPIPEKYGSITIGTWGNYDMTTYGGALTKSEFSEVDYYSTYALSVKAVDLSATYIQYTYPNGGVADKEVAFSVGKGLGETGLYSSLTANYGVGGALTKSWYVQGALDYEKSLSEALTLSSGISLGYAIKDDAEDGFNDAVGKVGLSYALTEKWSLNGSLNYVAQLDDKVLPEGGYGAYDRSFYAMLGASCSF
jgi:hypothetical protein